MTEKNVFETFRDIGQHEILRMTQNEPSCFNGIVRVTKVRVTIEDVQEDDDVIRARLKKLWDECKNPHHWHPLKVMANKYGMDFGK